MKGKLALMCLVVGLVVGCAAAPCVVPGAKVENGQVVFAATAKSVIAKEGDPLSALEAEVAATAMAKADLLETIKGARIGDSVTIGDLMFESQQTTVEVMGFLARADVTVTPPAETKLGTPPFVMATATLRLSKAELAKLSDYVE